MRRLLPLLAAAAVVAAGCTTEATERPPAPSAPPAAPAPARPREIRLDGVDPCSLLTPQQRAELSLTSEPRSTKPYVDLFRGSVPTCSARGRSPQNVLLVVGAVTTAGIERWAEGDIAATTRQTTVAGFPAIVAVPTRFKDYCNVEVDVAPGQLLDVQFGGGSAEAPIPQEQLCRAAERSAGQMVTTLLGR